MTAEPVSRRQVLKAGAGAAAAAGVLGVTALATTTPSVTTTNGAAEGAIMVRLRSEASGVLDLFVGTERLELHDAEIAARIAAAARPLARF
jgi:hypothetical protein